MTPFCDQLRFWRKHKKLSQMDVALSSNVSSKHISFLETGRANPSRGMVLSLCRVFDLNLRDSNDLLSLAGFSEQYKRTSLSQKDMQPVRQTLAFILDKQDPYPAIVLDWHWNIILYNKGFEWVMQQMKVECPAFCESSNIAELIIAENGFKPFLSNWEEIVKVTLKRIQLEQKESPHRHQELVKRLYKDAEVVALADTLHIETSSSPFIYVDFQLLGKSLRFLTTLTSFGTPIDITAAEILIEQYYPANTQTHDLMEYLRSVI